MPSESSRLQWLPVLICVWFPFSFITTYIIAVQKSHVYPFLPAISDTGTLPPESCYFGLLVNLLALLLTIAIWIRGKQLVELDVVLPGSGPGPRLNKFTTIVGYCSCFGLYLVANCQETNALLLHFVGALLAFWGTLFYSSFQAVFSYWLIGKLNTRVIFYTRLLLVLLQLVFNFLTILSIFVAVKLYKVHDIGSSLKWRPSDPGWEWHLTACLSEWLLMFCIALFVLTFYQDFQWIYLKAPQVTLKKVYNHPNTNGNDASAHNNMAQKP